MGRLVTEVPCIYCEEPIGERAKYAFETDLDGKIVVYHEDCKKREEIRSSFRGMHDHLCHLLDCDWEPA